MEFDEDDDVAIAQAFSTANPFERMAPNTAHIQDAAERVEQLLHQARQAHVESALHVVRELRTQIEVLEREAVDLARTYGWKWRDIAEVLGVAIQTVHRRYGPTPSSARLRR